MRSENRAIRRQRPARNVIVVSGVLLAMMTFAVPLWAGQLSTTPPWRDADEAARQLSDAQVRVLDSRDALVAAENRLVALTENLATIDAEQLTVAVELQATRELARDLAVAAYMSGGTITDALYLLDAATANDFAYRTTMLTSSADAVARSTDDFVQLRAESSVDALGLANEIDAMDRQIELAHTGITQAEQALIQAEWVMDIAEIHRGAEELIARWNRTDPTEEQWDQLRFCESGRNYAINTGNGFFGAYQFNLTTWVDMGGTGLPSAAPTEEQDARARYLYGLRGSGVGVGGPWPLCGRFLPAG